MWRDLCSSVIQANLDAQRVIALRLRTISRGGAPAAQEARRMVSEKIDAAAETAVTIASGGSPLKILKRYQAIMRANEIRLRRGTR